MKERGQEPPATYSHMNACNVCKENFLCELFAIVEDGKSDFDIAITLHYI